MPFHEHDQNYLKLQGNKKIQALQMDYPCPGMFTKLLKPVYFILRQKGQELIGYTNDQFTQGDAIDSCFSRGEACNQLPRSLQFVIHLEKSVLVPTQTLELLEFLVNTTTITISLTEVKKIKIKENCCLLKENKQPTVRQVANVICLAVSVFPVVQFAPLHYRHLQHDKSEIVKQKRGILAFALFFFVI